MEQDKAFIAIIEIGEDMTYSICSQDWGAVIVGEGEDIRQAKADFIEGVNYAIERLKSGGDERQATHLQNAIDRVVYRYDVRSFLRYYKLINLAQFAKYIGVSDTLLRQYKSGQYMSSDRALEIERGFRRIAEDLSAMG